jgi:hypothetical protein
MTLILDGLFRNCYRRMNELKQTAQLEEPFLMPGIPSAAADENGSEGGFRDDPTGDIGGKPRRGWVAVHFAYFGPAGHVNPSAHEGRQCKYLVKIACPPKEILVAVKFMNAIRAQLTRPAKEDCGVPT